MFLQQIGRGLRRAAQKAHLTIIDFVGNHRIFLDRLRLLLTQGPRPTPLDGFFRGMRDAILPPDCTIELTTEAKDLLAMMQRQSGRASTVEAYEDAREDLGRRPRPADLLAMGFDPADLFQDESKKSGNGPKGAQSAEGSESAEGAESPAGAAGPKGKVRWFEFVRSKGDLSADEEAVLKDEKAQAWLHEVQRTEMTKSFKMVVLEVMAEAGALRTKMALDELARRSLVLLRRLGLMHEVAAVKELAGMDWDQPDAVLWRRYWRGNPIAAWTAAKQDRPAWFEVQDGALVSKLPELEKAETLAAMTRELVEYRLARHRRVRLQERIDATKDAAKTTPPPRAQPAFRPRPMQAIRAYRSLRAAAGAVGGAVPAQDRSVLAQDEVMLPVTSGGEGLFAVQADGDSMEGGTQPIRSGDWLVMKWLGPRSLEAAQGKIALLEIRGDIDDDVSYQVKRVVPTDAGWTLRSENPEHQQQPAGEAVPLAVLVEVIGPERLAPTPET